MFKKLYINNFLTLQNFTLDMDNLSSILLVGDNGSGKSAVCKVFQILRAIGKGESAVDSLISIDDFSFHISRQPMRFEIVVELGGKIFTYVIVFELPENFTRPRVAEESLQVSGNMIFERVPDKIKLWRNGYGGPVEFGLDWHKVALPLIYSSDKDASLEEWKEWLRKILPLSPIPQYISGESRGENKSLNWACENFAEYITWMLGARPAVYVDLMNIVKAYMSDFMEFTNEQLSRDSRLLKIKFKSGDKDFTLEFDNLSDGEKCFFIFAAVQTALNHGEISIVFWDEPDSFISLWRVRQIILVMRRVFKDKGQIIITSHNREAIQAFSSENTFLLSRDSHLEPTRIERMDRLVGNDGDMAQSILLGEI